MTSPLEPVYEKYKHLDRCLSDPEWCTSGEGAAIYAIAGELWRAVKEAREQQQEITSSADIIKGLERSLEFYKTRMNNLQCWQSSMRDPERKIVCDILANGFTLTTNEEIDNAGNRPRPPCEECIYQSQSAEHNNAIKKKTIEEIMLWRKENRGKKLGYCTNGMIEDWFLVELIDKDSWSIEEHDARIAARATETENKRVLEELHKKVSASAFVCPEKTWVLGVIESLRLAQPEPKERDPE